MIIDNWATAPGNLNPLRRPEHIDQQTGHFMEALVEEFRRFREEVFAVTYCPGFQT
jgi:hypothetical protein